MGLPKNGQKVNNLQCPNCDSFFDEPQTLGKTSYCDENNGGCGWKFKISAVQNMEIKDTD